MAITLPYTLTAKTLARASQVMANFNALREATEGVAAASTASDAYQAGVLVSTDWAFTAAINETTGGLGAEAAVGGAAWLPGPGGGLVRTYTPPLIANANTQPPSLPLTGGYMTIGFELTASSAAAVISSVCGPERGSQSEAENSPPPITAGKMRVQDVTIKLTSSKYKIVGRRDRRPWARGATVIRNRTTPVSTASLTPVAVDTGTLQARVECSGAPVRVTLQAIGWNNTAEKATATGCEVDGVELDGFQSLGIGGVGIAGGSAAATPCGYTYETAAVTRGSHLFTATYMAVSGGTSHLLAEAASALQFTVEENLSPNANNGTT